MGLIKLNLAVGTPKPTENLATRANFLGTVRRPLLAILTLLVLVPVFGAPTRLARAPA